MCRGAPAFLCSVRLVLRHEPSSPPALGLCKGRGEGRQAPRRRWQLTTGAFSVAEAGASAGDGLVKDSLHGKIASQGQRALCVGSREHLPGKSIIPSGAQPEGVLSLTPNRSQINGSFLVSCPLLLVLPESLNHTIEKAEALHPQLPAGSCAPTAKAPVWAWFRVCRLTTHFPISCVFISLFF